MNSEACFQIHGLFFLTLSGHESVLAVTPASSYSCLVANFSALLPCVMEVYYYILCCVFVLLYQEVSPWGIIHFELIEKPTRSLFVRSKSVITDVKRTD